MAGVLAAVLPGGQAFLSPVPRLVGSNDAEPPRVPYAVTPAAADAAQRSFEKSTLLAMGTIAGFTMATLAKKPSKSRAPGTVAVNAFLGGTEDSGRVDFGTGYHFNREDLLGSGAYGKVYLCRNQSGQEFAMKQVFAGGVDAIEKEIETHRHIGKHENIVEMVDVFDVPGITDKRVVMELAKGGELTELLEEKGGSFSEDWAKGVFEQVISGVKHMHGKQVLHRDLKTDNILICTDSTHDADHPFVKLIDFGAAHWAKSGPLMASKYIGSIQTIAPEVILARGDDFDTTDPEQIQTTHEIVYKKRPFGIRGYRPGPGGIGAKVKLVGNKPRYPGDPIGQANVAGVQVEWAVKTVNGTEVGAMTMDDIIDTMGDRLLDNSSRGAFDGSFKVTGDNKGKGKVEAKVEMVDLPVTVQYAEMKPKPYDAKADVWSLGSILYKIVTGQYPFEPTEESVMAGKFAAPTGVSPQCVDLLNKMLVVDPAQRASLSDVENHPWLR